MLKVEAKILWCRASVPDLTFAVSCLVSSKLLLSNHTIYLLSKIILFYFMGIGKYDITVSVSVSFEM